MVRVVQAARGQGGLCVIRVFCRHHRQLTSRGCKHREREREREIAGTVKSRNSKDQVLLVIYKYRERRVWIVIRLYM